MTRAYLIVFRMQLKLKPSKKLNIWPAKMPVTAMSSRPSEASNGSTTRSCQTCLPVILLPIAMTVRPSTRAGRPVKVWSSSRISMIIPIVRFAHPMLPTADNTKKKGSGCGVYDTTLYLVTNKTKARHEKTRQMLQAGTSYESGEARDPKL